MENNESNPHDEGKRNESTTNFLIPSRKRLYKSPYNYVLFGICGGIGEYLNVSPILLRVLFVLTTLLGGWGLVAYAISFFLVPEHPSMKELGISGRLFTKRAFGFLLIGIGVYYWLPPFGIFNYFYNLDVSNSLFLLSMLVVLGILILLRGLPGRVNINDKPEKLYRSRKNRRLFGVAGGLAEYLQIDVNLFRLLLILLTFMTLGAAAVLYFLLFLILTEQSAAEVQID